MTANIVQRNLMLLYWKYSLKWLSSSFSHEFKRHWWTGFGLIWDLKPILVHIVWPECARGDAHLHVRLTFVWNSDKAPAEGAKGCERLNPIQLERFQFNADLSFFQPSPWFFFSLPVCVSCSSVFLPLSLPSCPCMSTPSACQLVP